MTTERLIEDWDGIKVTFVTLDAFGIWDITRIANQDNVANLTVVWETQTFPMQPARMEKLQALPKSAYLVAWCLPLEVAATLEEFRDWYMPRLRKISENLFTHGLKDITMMKGINVKETDNAADDLQV